MPVPAGTHAVAVVPVIPVSLNAWAQATVGVGLVVNVRAAGRYNDARTFETGPYKVPVFTWTPYAAPFGCTAPATLAACPQLGQTGTYACVSQ